MIKWIGLGLAALLATPLYAEQTNDPMGLIIKTMNRCYDEENKMGVEQAKCMLATFEKTDNPDGYQVFITDDNPSKLIPSAFKLIIQNKQGQTYTCTGVAANTIEIEQCVGKKEAPLTPGERLSAAPKQDRISHIASETKQRDMTPKQALQRLKDGNQRFLSNNLIKRDYLAQAKESSYGQYPWAVILNCMDSRSVPEFIFNQGLADLFTIRVAGNVLNADNLGSLEFATKVAGARLIVVMGHTSCGAVAGACAGVRLGHLDQVLDKITPLVPAAQKESDSDSCKPDVVNLIAKNNALHVADTIMQQSPIIRDLVAKKEVGIVAAMHNIKTGEVTFLEQGRLIHR